MGTFVLALVGEEVPQEEDRCQYPAHEIEGIFFFEGD